MIVKNLKRLGIFLLVTFLLVGCAKKEDPDKVLLQNYLEDYLVFKDELSEVMYSAYDSIDAYAASNSWEDLVQARASVKEALNLMGNMNIPEFNLSEEVCNNLLEDGIEIDAVKLEGELLKSNLAQYVEEMTGFLAALYDDIYYKSTFGYLGTHVQTNRKCLDLDLKSHSYLINYILVQSKDDQLWNRMPEICPLISVQRDEWQSDLTKLEQLDTEVLNEIENTLSNFDEYLGLSKYSLFIVQEAIENNDYENLISELNDIQNIPGEFLCPTWIDSNLSYQYLLEQDENFVTIEQGQAIDMDSCVLYVKTPDVKIEAIENYISKLDDLGMKYEKKWNETKDKLTLTVSNGECLMRIIWTDAETLIYLPAPVGDLVPELLYMAKHQAH